MIATQDEVYGFWFGELTADGDVAHEFIMRWWQKSDAFDAEIRARFGPTIDAASRGELSNWRRTPQGSVALIIVLDQFRRNVYRDTPAAFAQDPRARDVMTDALDRGDFDTLRTAERYILLMPSMHAEDVAVQARGLALFERARREAPSEAGREMLAKAVDFMKRHMVIVERFGRYPHRNAILGRESSDAERAFLLEPGSSF